MLVTLKDQRVKHGLTRLNLLETGYLALTEQFEGLTLKKSAFLPFTVANLHFQLSC